MKGSLFILVEGSDDERFFQKVVRPFFQKRYSDVRLWKYSKEKIEKRRAFLRSIKAMKADYIYVTDINEAVCTSSKKERVMEKLGVEKGKIIVVVREIEGWYLAGVKPENAKKLGISNVENTDSITKEDFNRLLSEGGPERYSWKEFSVITALKLQGKRINL